VQLFARRILPISGFVLAISLLTGTPAQASDWARFKVYNRTDKCAFINIQIQTAWRGYWNYKHFLLKPNEHEDVTFHEEAWSDVRAQAHVYDTEKCGGPTIAETYDEVKASGGRVSDGWLYPAILQRRANLKYMLYFEKIQP
jgi:hypothetical protein